MDQNEKLPKNHRFKYVTQKYHLGKKYAIEMENTLGFEFFVVLGQPSAPRYRRP